jgi:hypothetical protein
MLRHTFITCLVFCVIAGYMPNASRRFAFSTVHTVLFVRALSAMLNYSKHVTALAVNTYGECTWLYPFLMDMSCQLHAPADLPSRKEPTGRGRWGDPRNSLNAFDDRKPAVPSGIWTPCLSSCSPVTLLTAVPNGMGWECNTHGEDEKGKRNYYRKCVGKRSFCTPVCVCMYLCMCVCVCIV